MLRRGHTRSRIFGDGTHSRVDLSDTFSSINMHRGVPISAMVSRRLELNWLSAAFLVINGVLKSLFVNPPERNRVSLCFDSRRCILSHRRRVESFFFFFYLR